MSSHHGAFFSPTCLWANTSWNVMRSFNSGFVLGHKARNAPRLLSAQLARLAQLENPVPSSVLFIHWYLPRYCLEDDLLKTDIYPILSAFIFYWHLPTDWYFSITLSWICLMFLLLQWSLWQFWKTVGCNSNNTSFRSICCGLFKETFGLRISVKKA